MSTSSGKPEMWDYELTVQPAFYGDAAIASCTHCTYQSAVWKGDDGAEAALKDWLVHFQAKHQK